MLTLKPKILNQFASEISPTELGIHFPKIHNSLFIDKRLYVPNGVEYKIYLALFGEEESLLIVTTNLVIIFDVDTSDNLFLMDSVLNLDKVASHA